MSDLVAKLDEFLWKAEVYEIVEWSKPLREAHSQITPADQLRELIDIAIKDDTNVRTDAIFKICAHTYALPETQEAFLSSTSVIDQVISNLLTFSDPPVISNKLPMMFEILLDATIRLVESRENSNSDVEAAVSREMLAFLNVVYPLIVVNRS